MNLDRKSPSICIASGTEPNHRAVSPLRHIAASIIAQACDDYRKLRDQGIVCGLQLNPAHPYVTERYHHTSNSNNAGLSCTYKTAAQVSDLLGFFQNGGGLDEWAELACLPFRSSAVRCQLIGEENRLRDVPPEMDVL